MSNVKLSVCLVVKDEEKNLHRCLTSIKPAAYEIIVVDTGSTDRTIDIAKMYTDLVFKIKWRDDFSKARNFALDKASGDWILFVDGDEELEPASLKSLQKRISTNIYEGYLIKVLNYYQAGNQIEKSPDVIFRLFKNRAKYRYSGIIHEQIYDNILAVNPDAKIDIAEEICIIHYGYLKEEITAKKKAERNTRLLEKTVNKHPNNLLDRFHLGMEYFRGNQHDKALQEFLFVLDKVDFHAIYAPKLMRYITKCHYLLGNLEEALQFIETVWSKQFSDHGDLYYLKGLILKDLRRQTEAYSAFQHCLTLPAQPAYYANLYSQFKEKIYLRLRELAEELGKTQDPAKSSIPLSLCMIVKSEETMLPRCLKSVRSLVQEIIVVDTGSTDTTRETARECGAKVFDFTWNDDFAEARNFSLKMASGEWILVLDADEVLVYDSEKSFANLLHAPDVAGYFVRIVNLVGTPPDLETNEDMAVRLFRNRPEFAFEGTGQEQIQSSITRKFGDKALKRAPLTIYHDGYLNQKSIFC